MSAIAAIRLMVELQPEVSLEDVAA